MEHDKNNIYNLVPVKILFINWALSGQALIIEDGKVTGVVKEGYHQIK